jgi:hypothetical protein
MASYPIEIRRCRHIRTNGTQCGSPALKEKEFCYYHQENQPRAVELYIDGERYSDGNFMLPVFEDAHSIQMALRQMVELMFQRRIDRKDASGNLKTMQAERAKPTHVVVEPEKTGETPLGMTPWSASGEGHDVEEEGFDQGQEEEEIERNGGMKRASSRRSHVRDDRSEEELLVEATDPGSLGLPELLESPCHPCPKCCDFNQRGQVTEWLRSLQLARQSGVVECGNETS